MFCCCYFGFPRDRKGTQVNKTEAPTDVCSAVWREELELSRIAFMSHHDVSVVAKSEAVLRTADVCDAVKYFKTCACVIERETGDKHQLQHSSNMDQMNAEYARVTSSIERK